jgi:hypothetical protein
MVDLVVLLTPLLVLSVVALLGFAGCSFEARVGPDLALLARVPTGLTVTEVVFLDDRGTGQCLPARSLRSPGR